jgi:hypothetical protein
MKSPSEVDGRPVRRGRCIACSDATRSRSVTMWPRLRLRPPEDPRSEGRSGTLRSCQRTWLGCHRSRFSRPWIPSTLQASRPIRGTTLTVRGSAPTQHAVGNWRGPTGNNGQTANRQKTGVHGRFQDPHQRHELRLLPHVEPGDGPSDDHALDLRRALENREDRGGTGSFRR